MSQDRLSNTGSEPQKASSIYQAPDIDATLSRATGVMKKVRVVHGANEQYFDNLEGKTVGMIRKGLREVFNIPGDAEALVAGKKVGDDFVLEGGQNLEFVKEAGVKGKIKVDHHARIEQAAYYLWEKAGKPHGKDKQFYYSAEIEYWDELARQEKAHYADLHNDQRWAEHASYYGLS